jgi:hypothetical protein
MPFGGPSEKGLLDEIAGIAFCACQAHGKPIQGAVVEFDETLEIHFATATVVIV